MMPETHAGAPAGCRILDWDSQFFGVTIARIEPSALVENGGAVMAWCEAHVDCAYLQADAADQPAVDAAGAHGFQLMDLRVTLELSLAGRELPAAAAGIRPAVPSDLPALKPIARVSHRDTRFYVDRRFDRARCDELYDVWITKSVGGWADHVVVAEVDGAAAGYVTCNRRSDHGEIALVGVSAAYRGSGLAMAMTIGALRWFQASGLTRVTVATQARNTAGLRLYQKAGFAVRTIEMTFHRWWRAQ